MNENSVALQKRMEAFVKSNTPIKANGKTLTIEDISFSVPKALNDYSEQLKMKFSKDGSLMGYLRGKVVIKDDKTGKVLSESGLRNILPIYYETERGTFLINGTERNIINKVARKSGIYTKKDDESISSRMFFDSYKDSTAEYMPNMAFTYSPSKNQFKVIIGKKGTMKEKNFDGVSFLRAIGFSDPEIVKCLGNNSMSDSIMKATHKPVTIKEIYKQVTGQESTFSDEMTRENLFAYLASNANFEDDSVLKANIGVAAKHLDRYTIAKTVERLFSVTRGAEQEDDSDDLRFKQILNPNDQIMEQVQSEWQKFVASVQKDLQSPNNNILSSLHTLSSPSKNSITRFLKGGMSKIETQSGPLAVEGMLTETSQMREGQTSSQSTLKQRNLKGMSMNRIDPIDIPENDKTGLIEHLSENAKVKNGTIYIDVLKVKQGVATNTPANTVEIDPSKEYESKIAFHDLSQIKKSGNKLTLTGKNGKVKGRYRGQMTDLSIAEVQYIDKNPQTVFGDFANMIPFVTHNDGNRVTFGSKMQRQSMVLKNREEPIVSVVSSTGKTYEDKIGEKFGKPIYCTINGTVTKIADSKIYVKAANGKVSEYQYYNYFPVNSGYINNELKVKVGDKVKSGDILAEGWQTKNGKLATGVNAKVAFMSYKGYNYEDGLVVSESFAKKMAVEDVQNIEIEFKKDWIGGVGSNAQLKIKNEGKTNNQEIFTKLDKDGIIKVGEQVKAGSILAAYLRPAKENTSIISIFKNPSKSKQEWDLGCEKIPAGSYVGGQVKRVVVVQPTSGDAKQKIVITVVQTKGLKEGDKLAGKHGNKGTISLILPDEKMPQREDGERLDVLYSCAAVPSRKNPGQILETNAGLIAEKTGKRMVVNNFDPNNLAKIKKGLKDIGYADGKMKVILPEVMPDGKIKKIKTDNPITVGNMYMMKLVHKVDDKIQSRVGDERGIVLNKPTNMPGKIVGSKEGERHNPMSLDSMATDALQGHQAIWNILECTTIKADGGGDAAQRAAMFNAMKTGKIDGLDQYSAVPETVNVLAKKLKSLGMNVVPVNNGKAVKNFSKNFNAIKIAPMKPSEMIKMIGAENEVKDYNITEAKSDNVNARRKDGLADERIFGELNSPESKDKWGYIKLVTPVANPVYAGLTRSGKDDIYSVLTGIQHSKIKSMSEGKLVMIADPDEYNGAAFNGLTAKEKNVERSKLKANMKNAGLKPGDLIDPTKLEQLISKHGEILWKAGNEGLLAQLDKIDVNKSITETKKALKKASSKDIDLYYRRLKALTMLKENKMEASDLMLKYVPVMPLYLRDPGLSSPNKQLFKIDTNTHYQNIIKKNDAMKKTIPNGTDLFSYRPPKTAASEAGSLYTTVANLTGHIDGVDWKTKEATRGIISDLSGKTGLIHSKMMKKRQDFSARSVIGVDPYLGVDEVGIPMDIAKTMYKFDIIKTLVKTGRAKDEIEAEQKWTKLDSDTKDVIYQLAKKNPVMINRAPSLHKFSVQAFKPVIKDNKEGLAVRNIQLNPLVVTGFNADFDGDQMSVYTPVTERAKKEALDKLLPSKNLVSETNGKMLMSIRHEMALGIYYLTMDYNTPTGKSIAYSNMDSLRKDYMAGKIRPSHAVKVNIPGSGTVSTIAGQALVNSILPKNYRNFKQAWDGDKINDAIKKMYQENEESNGKTISIRDITSCLEKLKTLGFEASTRSGISLGINDFADQKTINKKYGIDKLDKLRGEDRVKAWNEMQNRMSDDLKKGKLLSKKNPAQILLDSKARGSADQYRRIMGTTGIGKDIEGKTVSPIAPSHLQGFSPEEYFVHGFDSRKGLYDRSVSTVEPGTIFKGISSAMQGVVVKEKDCGTSDGIFMKKTHKSLIGRVAAEEVYSKGGKKLCRKGQIITQAIRDNIYKYAVNDDIKVRSPLRCKTVNGVCAKCYGCVPGTSRLPKEGTPVGVLAAQAIGEPIQQATMNTFHTGGTASSSSSAVSNIRAVLGASVEKGHNAVLASSSGKITKIEHGPVGSRDIVYIDGKKNEVPHYTNGQPRKLRVSVGDYVTKGDFLTVGSTEDINNNQMGITMAKPINMFKLKSDVKDTKTALNETKDYMASTFDQAMTWSLGGNQVGQSGKVDRKHMELITNTMTSTATVTDSGTSPFTKGDTVNRNQVDKWNDTHAGFANAKTVSMSNASNIVGKISAKTLKKGTTQLVAKGQLIDSKTWQKLVMNGVKRMSVCDAPIEYKPNIQSIEQVKTSNPTSWVSNLAAGKDDNLKTQIARASMMGATDPLDDNRSRRMTGKLLRIGEGFNVPRNLADNFSNNLSNFFKGIGKKGK